MKRGNVSFCYKGEEGSGSKGASLVVFISHSKKEGKNEDKSTGG